MPLEHRTRRSRIRAAGLSVGALLMAPVMGGVADAATFVVNSTIDSVDANPGDGICEDEQGRCTLRAAILETNALPGADGIFLKIHGTPHVLSLAGSGEDSGYQGDLDITDHLSITFNLRFQGPPQPAIIDGGDLDRVFDIRKAGAKVTIQGVTIRRGATWGEGGGIRNAGTLTLTSTIVTSNTALSHGAGIYNARDAIVTLTDSTVSSNLGAGFGGGIYNLGTVNLTNSTVVENYCNYGTGAGGGIYDWGTVNLTNSTVSGNWAGGDGGGIYVRDGSTLNSFHSTISDNLSDVAGGGVYNLGTAVLVNTTVSGNSAVVDSRDAGIVAEVSGVMTLVNCTVTDHAIGIVGLKQFAFNVEETTLWLVNTIVAGNSVTDCLNHVGQVASGGHNVDSDNTCNLTAPGDIPGINPLLGPLKDNGGPTFTHALLAGSPAIDAANDASCPPLDQRGFARPFGQGCDIGAYEFGAAGDRGR
jgi:CSLREA domain-containing protein